LRSGPHKPTVSHPLNRFGGNMGPYVDAMLPLRSVEYINASPIDNLGEGAPWFVATMCPKRETFAHFWSMVWEMGSRVIINLTHERDRVGSGPSDKRERYWPPFNDVDERELAHWPILPRTLFTESCEQVPALLRYAIELSGPVPRDGGPRPTRVVALYWYSRWIDFPSSTSIGSRPFYENAWAVLHIAMHVNSELHELGQKHWAVCHCSAGVGRTGTFIALTRLLRLLPTVADEPSLDKAITATIEAMRDRRLWMVKTDIEYATLYAAVLLRLRNPDPDEFALTWPLKDGARTVTFDRDRFSPRAGLFNPTPKLELDAAMEDQESTDPSVMATLAAVEAAAKERASPAHRQVGAVAGEPTAVRKVPSQVPSSTTAKDGSSGVNAGGRQSGGGGIELPAHGASLHVRTPEEEDENAIGGDAAAARGPLVPPSGLHSALRTSHAGARGPAFMPSLEDYVPEDWVDNSADCAKYIGVDVSSSANAPKPS